MNPLQQLIQDRAHKALSAKDLVSTAEAENRAMTADEVALFDKLESEIKSLDARISEANEHAARAERLGSILDRLGGPAGRQTAPDAPASPAPLNAGTVPASPIRYRRLKAFKGKDADARAYRAGMWLRGRIFGDERCMRYCVNHGIGVSVRNALGENDNSKGGFLVPTELSETIIDLREDYGVFRQEAFVQPMGRDSMNIPRRLGGVTIGPVGENPSSSMTESTPTWNDVQLNAKKCGGFVRMSSEIAEDAIIDLADYVANEFAYAFAKFEDQCGWTGDSTSTYLGINGLTKILIAGQSLVGAVDAASGHDTFAEIDLNDLTTMMAVLPEYARANAKFYCSAVCWDAVFSRLMANAGGNTIQSLNGTVARNFLGYPVVVSQVLPTSTGDLSDVPMLFFGDLSMSSTLGDRREMRIFPSDQRYFEFDQIAIRGTSRFDIVNHDYGDTSVAGPIVALVGE